MTLGVTAITAAEQLPLPDHALRFGIGRLVGRTRRLLAEGSGPTDRDFARSMSEWPIAVHTDDANTQHYELPAAFFSLVLGPLRKYSSCLYASPATTLAEAEIAALDETCLHADLADGQDSLELGCGWVPSRCSWQSAFRPVASSPFRIHPRSGPVSRRKPSAAVFEI
jgi:cyclopropane-fatty-acyl-phospholipid synthase